MEPDDIEVLQLELKYCERCGGLWLRVRGTQDVYCAPCSEALSEVAIGRPSRRPPRLPVPRNIHGQHITAFPFFEKGGHA
jgi:hypothetical protein